MWWLPAVDGPIPVGDIIYGLGVTIELIGIVYVSRKYSVQNSDIAIAQTQTKAKQQENYVYHMTNSEYFVDNLQRNGASAVDPNIGPGTSGFGNKFYVAGDKITSLMEATNIGIMLRFSMSDNARILDLTNPDIAKAMGYEIGMTREAAQQLMKSWDLTGYDAIKYPSEKNPGGVNYGVINPAILTFEGVEGL